MIWKPKLAEKSDLDAFIEEFEQGRESPSLARKQEIEKHKDIALRRDTIVDDPEDELWKGFYKDDV